MSGLTCPHCGNTKRAGAALDDSRGIEVLVRDPEPRPDGTRHTVAYCQACRKRFTVKEPAPERP